MSSDITDSNSSSGYKGDYLEEPNQHYREITALRDEGRSWSWITSVKYDDKVSRVALSRWYKRHTQALAEEQEKSAQEELAELKKK